MASPKEVTQPSCRRYMPVLGDAHVDDLAMLVHGPIHVDTAVGEELLKVTV